MVSVFASANAIQSQLRICNYTNIVSFVILYYDYALTLPAEVERFWSSRTLTWAAGFFYLNRYLSLFGHIPVLFQTFLESNDIANKTRVCQHLVSYHQYLAVIIQVIVGILLIMRTYALYERSIRVLLFILGAAMAVIGFGIWCVAAGPSSPITHDDVPQVGCILPILLSDAKRLAAAWTAMVFFDVLIIIMTLYKSLMHSRSGGHTLLHVIIRDGAIYFGVMVVVSLANILTFFLAPEYQKGFVTTFANIISSAMISRLMLNLRDPKLSASYRSSRSNHHHHQHYRSASQTTSGIFTTDAVLSTVVDVVDTSFCDQEGRAGAGRSTAPPGCQAVDTGQADVEGATNFGAIELTSRTHHHT